MVKKKKDVITIKTSLKSVLLDNEAAQEFKESLEELVKKQHVLRIGTQQFIHWYLLNRGKADDINKTFIQATITVMNGLFPKTLKETSKFGKAYWDLVPLVHEFISISGSQKIFAPTIHSLEERAKEYCVKNPKPVKWRSKHNYEECILGNNEEISKEIHVWICLESSNWWPGYTKRTTRGIKSKKTCNHFIFIQKGRNIG